MKRSRSGEKVNGLVRSPITTSENILKSTTAIPGKRRLCQRNKSENDSSEELLPSDDENNSSINIEDKNHISGDNDSKMFNDSDYDTVLSPYIKTDDSSSIIKILLKSEVKNHKVIKPKSSTVDLYDCILSSSFHAAYKCLELFLSLDFLQISKSIRNLCSNNDITTSAEFDVSNIFIDLSPKRMKYITSKLSSGKSAEDDSPSPLTVALNCRHLDIIRLVCEKIPLHALQILDSPIEIQRNEGDGQSEEEEDDNDAVSVLFSLVSSNDHIILTTALTTIDKSLLNQAMVTNSNNDTQLHHPKTVELLHKGQQSDGSTIMHWAVEEGQLDFVKALLELDPTLIGCRDHEYLTPLHSACLMSQLEICQLLARTYGADINALDQNGWSPFIYAIFSDSVPCVLALLDRGEDVALRHLARLGEILTSGSIDHRLQQVLESLATVPEFHKILNELIRKDSSLIKSEDGNSGGVLRFVDEFPFLLNLNNKLVLAKYKLTQYSNASIFTEKFHILRGMESRAFVMLQRSEPWISFERFLKGECNNLGERIPNSQSDGRFISSSSSGNILSAKDKAKLVLRSKVLFQFYGETGIGHGVEREVLSSISKAVTLLPSPSIAMTTNNHHHHHSCSTGSENMTPVSEQLFICLGDTSQTYIPIAVSDIESEEEEDLEQHFYFFGQLIGHLFLRKICDVRDNENYYGEGEGEQQRSEEGFRSAQDILSFNISSVFWKIMLGLEVDLNDLAGLDAVLYQNLNYLLNNPRAEELSLTFTISNDMDDNNDNSNNDHRTSSSSSSSSTSLRSINELVKGGSKKTVTDKNKKKYVNLVVEHRIKKRMEMQAEWMRNGILEILPENCFQLFSESEIGQLMGGMVEIDINDWERHAVYSGWDNNDQAIFWFWKLVRDLGVDQRALLLRFCTGCSRLPVGGFSSLSPPFTIARVPMDIQRSLPTASTCFNLMKLPAYLEENVLRRQLMTAIVMGSEGFSFS